MRRTLAALGAALGLLLALTGAAQANTYTATPSSVTLNVTAGQATDTAQVPVTVTKAAGDSCRRLFVQDPSGTTSWLDAGELASNVQLWPTGCQSTPTNYNKLEVSGIHPYPIAGVYGPVNVKVKDNATGSTVLNVPVTLVVSAAGGDTTAPSVPTNLHETTSTQTSVSFAWNASTDNVGVTSYDVYQQQHIQDLGLTGTSDSVTGLACGSTYSFSVRANDAAGNHSAQTSDVAMTTAACTGGGDTTPPSVPTNLRKVSSTATTITMAWDASTDNVGVASYDVYRGANWDRLAVTGTTYTADFQLACGTSTAFKVKANDAAGNTSAFSPEVSMSTDACAGGGDTTAPSVPTNLHQTASGQTTVDVAWTASTDDTAVTGYDAYRGGVLQASPTATAYQYTGLACGTSYTSTVRAGDAAGNHSAQTAGVTITTAACSGGGGQWVPPKALTWYWQLQGTINTTRAVAAYDIDGENNTAATVATLHGQGKKVICYFSAGTYEPFRSDAASIPTAARGNSVQGFAEEQWLDVRNTGIRPTMTARMQACKDKGFDAVEPDNVDGYTNSTGFPLTAADQTTYNTWLATTAHSLGLAVFLKNDIDQIAGLQPSFDGAINEQCAEFAECGGYSAFLNANKPVLEAEYTGTAPTGAFCTDANSAGREAARFNIDLDGTTFTPCWQ